MTVNVLPNTQVILKYNKIYNLILINKDISISIIMLVFIVTMWNVNIYIYIYVGRTESHEQQFFVK